MHSFFLQGRAPHRTLPSPPTRRSSDRHDEQDEAKVGDKVAISETRPMSRRKRWRSEEHTAGLQSHRYISYALFFFTRTRPPPNAPLSPYTTLFRSAR